MARDFLCFVVTSRHSALSLSTWSSGSTNATLGVSRTFPGVFGVGFSGKRHSLAPASSLQPFSMECPSGCTTETLVAVKTTVFPMSTNGPNPMRELVNDGITCPSMADAGSDGTDARVAVAMERSALPLATRTPMVGALWSRFAVGASLVKKKPLAPESAMPVWAIGSWGGLLAKSSSVASA